MPERDEKLQRKLCEELYWATKMLELLEGDVRKLWDEKLILGEDASKLIEEIERAKREAWRLKGKYGCIIK